MQIVPVNVLWSRRGLGPVHIEPTGGRVSTQGSGVYRAALYAGLGMGSIGLSCAGAAVAQAVEHNPPLPVAQPVLTPAEIVTGPILTAVVIPGDDGRISLAGLSFIGQPVSAAVIHRLEAAIDRKLVEDGRPALARFVAVPDAAPGVVTFSIAQARVGTVKMTGAPPADARAIEADLGLKPGAMINRAETAGALDSLNRYPFRQVTTAFAPETSAGIEDVAVTVTEQKPWQFIAGFKYEGSSALTWQRAFAGLTVGNWLGQDSVLAFQATASPNDIDLYPEYRDYDLTYSKPVSRDGVVEAGIDVTDELFHYPPDDYWLIEVDGTLDYRRYPYDAAGQNIGDVRVGVEARHEHVRTIVAGAQTKDDSEEMYELFAGYHRTLDMASAHDDIDLSLHGSSGGVDPGNSDAHFVEYSGDRMRSARYAYLDVTLDHAQALTTSLSWHSQVSAQLASGPMPYYVQDILGGVANVRGYFLYDGSADDALIARNEWGRRPKSGGLAPDLFVFLDAGSGYDAQLHTTKTLASTGLGMTSALTARAVLHVDVDHALCRGTVTPAGTNAVEANLTYKY